jgi:hypothetical protein
LKIYLVSESDEVAAALADEFVRHPYKEVTILKGDMFEKKFDCAVGNGSSFGLLAGSRVIK